MISFFFFFSKNRINTGPVVAGVLGTNRLTYDVWGDAVNTASRIESNGVPGRISISTETYDVVKDIEMFRFEPAGEAMIKGKGIMTTFFVELTETDMYMTEDPAPKGLSPTPALLEEQGEDQDREKIRRRRKSHTKKLLAPAGIA